MADAVTQFKDVTLIYDAPNGATYKLSTDMPGSSMALRRTVTVPATTTRETRTFPLDKLVDGGLLEGKMIRHRLESPGVVRLYNGWIRFRRLGVYIDGGFGDVWETQELSLL